MWKAEDVVGALGGEWHGVSGLAPCPVCQSQRRVDQRGLSVGVGRNGALFYCHKSACSFKYIRKALEQIGLRPSDACDLQQVDEARKAKDREQRDRARKLWERAVPIAGTPAERYLRGRGITGTLPSSLRWSPRAFHMGFQQWFGAMVANVSTGGVHRTYFNTVDARLATDAKMMQGPCLGGAVTLRQGPGPLIVCEGIETGLSLGERHLRDMFGPGTIWACLSTKLMQGVILPPKAGHLVIAADGDEAGGLAAKNLALRAEKADWTVEVKAAPHGSDWNDILRENPYLEMATATTQT